MRFERLLIERFGHFESLDLDLSGGSGLVLVHGPNEAGKSTLLRAIHGLLFGIDERSPDNFRFPYPAMTLSAVLRDGAGQRIDIARRKKRKDALLGTLRTDLGDLALDEPRFARYFGAVTEDLYRQIFGFTHEDLQRGAEVLEVANLGELLGGGALGGSAESLRRVLAALHDESDDLFKIRGKNPPVNQALAQLHDTRVALRDATLQQPQYLDLTRNLKTARDTQSDADAELARLRHRAARIHTLLLAFEDFHEHQRLDRRLADPDLASPLAGADATRVAPLLAELHALRTRHQTLADEIDRLERRTAHHPVDHALLAEAATVERLLRRVEPIAQQRREAPRTHARLLHERAALLAQINNLSPGTSPSDLSHGPAYTSISQPELDQLHQAVARWQRLRQELALQRRTQADDAAELAALTTTSTALAAQLPDDRGRELLAALEPMQADHAELERADLDLARLDAEIDLARARLHPRPAGDPARLPLPGFASVQDLQVRRQELDADRREAHHHLSQQTAELARLDAELAVLAEHDLPDPILLTAARARRDDAWSLVRQHLLSPPASPQRDLFAPHIPPTEHAPAYATTLLSPHDAVAADPTGTSLLSASPPPTPPAATRDPRPASAPVPSQYATPRARKRPLTSTRRADSLLGHDLPDLSRPRPDVADPKQLARSFERTVTDADRLADRLRDAAGHLAQKTSLDAARERALLALARTRDALAALDVAEAAWSAAWHDLWRPSEISPGTPTAMLAWLTDAAALRDLAVTRARRAREADARRPRVHAFEARLRDLLASDAPWPTLVHQLRERERVAEHLRGRLESSHSQTASLRASLARTAANRDLLEQDHDAAITELRRRITALGLPPDLDPESALQRLDTLSDLTERLAALDRQRLAADQSLAALADFDAEVAALRARLEPALKDTSPVPTDTHHTAQPVPEDTHPRDTPPEHYIESLGRRLADARAAATTHALARDESADRRREHARLTAALTTLQAEAAALRARAGVADDLALADLAERTLHRLQLERTRDDLRLRLARTLGEGDPRAAYAAELQAARREDLEAEQHTLARAISELDQRRLTAVEQRGRLEHEAKHLGGDRAARLGAELEVLRADLEEHADRFVLLHLAERVLGRVADRYARDNQPAILQYTSEMLARITAGRHLRAVVQPETRTLAALGRDGLLRTGRELSSGTREQMFLALRLAYVLDYCERCEPLPVIMDDVLVNFDDTRAAAALAALRDLARSTQVILLTCHRRWLTLAPSAAPDARIVELPPEPAAITPVTPTTTDA